MMSNELKQIRERSNPLLKKVRELDANMKLALRGATGQTDSSVPVQRLYNDCYMSAAAKIVTIVPRESGQISLYGDNNFDDYLLPTSITLDFASGTSGRKHAIYLYIDASATATVTDNPKIVAEFEAWTNETTRATSLDNVLGVLLKSSDYSRRWIGDAYYDGTLVSVMGGVDPLSGTYFGTGDPNNADSNTTGTGQQQPGILVNGQRLNIFTVAAGLFKFGVTFVNALFGNDISDPNKTGFSIFFSAQTYNTESMEAGSVLLGSNSNTYANILWKPSVKQLQFRNGTNVQAYVDVTGAITAGGGAVVLDSSGETILASASESASTRIKFNTSGGTAYANIACTEVSPGDVRLFLRNLRGTTSSISINSDGSISFSGSGGFSGAVSAPNLFYTVKKTADQSITSTATLGNDSELIIALLAGTKYHIRGRIWFDTTAAADFKYRFQYTGTFALAREFYEHIVPGTATLVPFVETTFPTTTQAVLGAGTTGGYVEIDCIIHVTNAGNFIFQWAQNTSDPGSTIVRAGSYLEYLNVA